MGLRSTSMLALSAALLGMSASESAACELPRTDRDPKPENDMEDLMCNELFGVPNHAPRPDDTYNSDRMSAAEAKRARKAAARLGKAVA